MKFRIRSLMLEIAMASFLMAIWHLSPPSRLFVLGQVGAFYAMNVPYQIYARTHPGPRSAREIAGFVAYDASILAGLLAIFLRFPDLSARMATWPG